MHLTVANDKGGVTKTTTAVCLATYLAKRGKTLLIDKDQTNASATAWGESGKMPFTILSWEQGIYQARNFEHVVIDTKAGEDKSDIGKLASGCDLLVIPVTPGRSEIKSLLTTIVPLQHMRDKYKVLMSKVPPRSALSVSMRNSLKQFNIPHFKAEIPRLNAFDIAFGAGVPVYDAADDYAAEAWRAYEAVGKEIWNAKAAKA